MNPRLRALEVLCLCDPTSKATQARALFADLDTQQIDPDECIAEPADLPGRPAKPTLVAPQLVPMRSPFTLEGRAALLHAITHIEFNAINLALDAVCRFAAMPDDYYFDWITVAKEESYHFTLLSQHLKQRYGYDYGDFAAHDGLWAMAEKTRHDVLTRMALVPPHSGGARAGCHAGHARQAAPSW